MPRAVYALKREEFRDSPSVSGRRKRIVYPDSDGKPMADNTKQFRWIVKIKEGLEVLFADRADVFVAGDLLWYPVEGDNKIRIAPDALVVFGRPKGDRGSYRQWEEDGIAPQAVFEVLSPGNTKKEMAGKLTFYEKYGVEEYYEYDPDRIALKGWLRSGNRLEPIADMQGWISPCLGIRFELREDDLDIFRSDGQRFLDFLETEMGKKLAERQADLERRRAEKEQKRAERAEAMAGQEKMRADLERKRAEQSEKEKQQAEAFAEKEHQRAEMLIAKLRELGITLASDT